MSGTVRAVTLNLWGEQPPLETRMALVQRELLRLRPDIVALQEVRQVPGQVPNQAETLAQGLSYRYVFAPTVEWGGGQEGLAILSQRPILSSGHVELPHAAATERRIVLWATIDTAAGVVAAFSTHLNYRMTHGVIREDQVAAVDRVVGEVVAAQQARVGILMGDFNATPDSDEIRYLRGLHTLQGRRTYYQDAYLLRHGAASPGPTWSRRNPFTQRLRFLESDRRIDYIFVTSMSRDGRGQVQDCRIVLDVPDGQGVYPSDHFGVMAEVQVAPLD